MSLFALRRKVMSFIEDEARSCSIDLGHISIEYVYRIWRGQVPLNEIKSALKFQNLRLK